MTSGVMPVPVSLTHKEMYWPGGRPRSLAARTSSHLLAVSMVIRPPSGIASRALIVRLSRAFFQLRAVDLYNPEADSSDDGDLDARANYPSEHVPHAGDQTIHVQGPGIQRLTPRESEQSLGCPSSDDLRQFGCFRKGGSGSSVVEIKRDAGDAANDDSRWSGV
jgi:hypothetical protein